MTKLNLLIDLIFTVFVFVYLCLGFFLLLFQFFCYNLSKRLSITFFKFILNLAVSVD